MQHCKMQLASSVWWQHGKIVKSLYPSPKKSGFFISEKRESKEASDSGVWQQTHTGV